MQSRMMRGVMLENLNRLKIKPMKKAEKLLIP